MSQALKSAAKRTVGTRHGDDLYTWANEQVAHLRAGRLDSLDLAEIAEELSDVGNEIYFRLESALAVLLQHMLKWDHQEARRSRSWVLSITEQRDRVDRLLRRNPGLKGELAELLDGGYRSGRRRALDETGLPDEALPETCPYDWAAIMERPFVYDPSVHRLKD
jgi:Domain of unknown function DUF29